MDNDGRFSAWPGVGLPFLLASVIATAATDSAYANDRYHVWQAERPFTQSAWATHDC